MTTMTKLRTKDRLPGGNVHVTEHPAAPSEDCVGYVTEFHTVGKHLMGAFIKVPVYNGAGPMLYAKFGKSLGDGYHEVVSVREIGRDEFDRMTEIESLRRDLGWR